MEIGRDPKGGHVPGRGLFSAAQWQQMRHRLGLTQRECQVLQHLFDDDSEGRIAREMGISTHTVHTHIRRMYSKAGVHTRCTLVLKAIGTIFNSQEHHRQAER